MTNRRPIRITTLALALTLPALSGCSARAQYIIQQGLGQICMIVSSKPIDHVLADGKLDPEQERKLRLVIEAREFARQSLGLHVGGSFSLYHDTGGSPVAYNVSAAHRDCLTPKSWQFPLVGGIDYIGFFDRRDAQREAANLENQSYDTYVYGVDAYSTLGWFPDPVHSSFLSRSDGSLVETVIHELAHNTVYAPGHSNFNESLATFIGRRGARLFYERQGDEGRQLVEELEQSYADQQHITAWMTQFEAELREYYARDLPADEKIAGREAVFQAARDRFINQVRPELNQPDRYSRWADLPTNNAFVLLNRRYNLDLDVFEAAYDHSNGDFAAFLDALRAAAGADDPFAHLQQAAGSP